MCVDLNFYFKTSKKNLNVQSIYESETELRILIECLYVFFTSNVKLENQFVKHIFG